jgi:hypothetical protein
MDIKILLSELEKLNLPKNKFAITSSGPLGIRNIREINDLDIIVCPDLWDELSKKYKITKENDFESIYIGNIQVLGKGSWFTDPTFGDVTFQINNADLFDGCRYVSIKTILEIKKRSVRVKDMNDVKLIEKYLSEKTK